MATQLLVRGCRKGGSSLYNVSRLLGAPGPSPRTFTSLHSRSKPHSLGSGSPSVESIQARHYWWSSKAPAAADAAQPPVPPASSAGDSAPATSSPTQTVEPNADALASTAHIPSPPQPGAPTSVASSLDTSETLAGAPTSVVPSVDPSEPLAGISSLPLDPTLGDHLGDMASLGLARFSLPGVNVQLVELIHVATGLPWLPTIVVSSIATRAIVVPFLLSQIRAAARLAPFQSDLRQATEEIKEAQAERNYAAMQRASLKSKAIMAKANYNIGRQLAGMLVVWPVQLGMFLALRKMCALPVEGMKDSGVPWGILSDLTVPDPTWIIPGLTVAAILGALRLSLRHQANASAYHPGHVANAMTVPILAVGLPTMSFLPVGVGLYALTGAVLAGAQSIILTNPAVRRKLKIPPLQPSDPSQIPSMLDTVRAITKYVREQMEAGKRKTMMSQTPKPGTLKRR